MTIPASTLPRSVRDVIQQMSTLPPFPRVTSKLLSLLKDESVSIDELTAVIMTDPSLVAKVIHLSNSPFYMLSRPVASVKEALFVLGINAIKSLATSLSVQKGLSALQPRTSVFDMMAFWKHSYATAIVAHKIGKGSDSKRADTLYLGGLVHDVGKMVLAYHWPDLWKAMVRTQEGTGEPLHVIEVKMFPYTHARVAAELLDKWSFPPDIVSLIAELHGGDLEANSGECNPVSQASRLASIAGYKFPVAWKSVDRSELNEDEHRLIADLHSDLAHQLAVLAA